MKKDRFNELMENNLKILQQYVPIVDRVHGTHHPEFHDVRRVFDEMLQKIEGAVVDRPDLGYEFQQLREITDSYTVPGDVCESYEAVYNMLFELDEAYHV